MTCPKCQLELRLMAGSYGRFELAQCDQCKKIYRIEKQPTFQDVVFESMKKITRSYMVLGGEK